MFGVLQEMPGVTAEEYKFVEENLGPDRPAGLVAHVSGPTESGWRIINIWESEEHFQRFQSERLFRAAGWAAQRGFDVSKAANFSSSTVVGEEMPF